MFAWTFGTAFSSLAGANAVIGIYSLYHPNYTPQRWQIFIAFLGLTWIACSIVRPVRTKDPGTRRQYLRFRMLGHLVFQFDNLRHHTIVDRGRIRKS